jgi:hypothetical protein
MLMSCLIGGLLLHWLMFGFCGWVGGFNRIGLVGFSAKIGVVGKDRDRG